MKQYKVHYWRDPSTILDAPNITREGLADTHQHIATIHAEDPDHAYRSMQGELMPPEEAARIGPLAGHTSMSVGDALEEPDGTLHICQNLGWNTIPPTGDPDKTDELRNALTAGEHCGDAGELDTQTLKAKAHQ